MALKTTPNVLKRPSNVLKWASNYTSFGQDEAIFRRNSSAGQELSKHPHGDVFKASGDKELRRKTSADTYQNIRNALLPNELRKRPKRKKIGLVKQRITTARGAGCTPGLARTTGSV